MSGTNALAYLAPEKKFITLGVKLRKCSQVHPGRLLPCPQISDNDENALQGEHSILFYSSAHE